ncbi:hypothetical protein [Actinoplanes palleronii]|uniref:Uncharacterized protein n=1 Tax=Actinoplanes palleronii TaxID=113570 RepID=A0ABQ4BEM2_9ACTN|nr:hypothetical protein [Actinoplanes palleronii]GIE69118.1 hypothetical protein Apa02nite_052260 [Actinoplanes palleronii]
MTNAGRLGTLGTMASSRQWLDASLQRLDASRQRIEASAQRLDASRQRLDASLERLDVDRCRRRLEILAAVARAKSVRVSAPPQRVRGMRLRELIATRRRTVN